MSCRSRWARAASCTRRRRPRSSSWWRCTPRRSAPAASRGRTVLPEWIVATTTDPTGSGLKFGIARPVGDALVDLQRTSARNAALGLGFIGLALIVIVPLSARPDAQPRHAERRRPSHRRRRLQRPRAGALERRDRASRRRLQPDGGRRRAAPAIGRVAGADPPRAGARPPDSARHAAARAAAARPDRDQGGVGAGARGRRRLLQLLPAARRPHRAAGRRRVGQGRRRGAADGQPAGGAADAPRARAGSRLARAGARRRHRSHDAGPCLRHAVRRHPRSRRRTGCAA